MKKSFSNIVFFLVFSLLITQPAFPYKKVKCFVLKPPEQILPGVQRIAIIDFESEGTREQDEKEVKSTEDLVISILSELAKSDHDADQSGIDHGRNFSDYLISELLKSGRGIQKIKTGFLGLGGGREGKTLQEGTFTNVFDIVERTQLMRILEEQKLSASGVVDQNQVVELGNMLGVQAIVTGNIGFTQVDTEYKQSRTKKKGDKTETYKVDCQKREVNVTVRTRVISTETGKILGSKESKHKITKSTCSDQSTTLPTADEMIDAGLKALSTEIANYITPHYELVSYELEKIKVKSFKNAAEKAAKLAENLKVDEAYAIYKLIYDKDPYNPEVMYNLSILNEVVGNFAKAKELADMAYQLKDEGRYKDALERLEKNEEFAEALAQIGIEIKEHNFAASKAKAHKVLAKKVKIKGGRDIRVKVLATPDPSSKVVARVPGDLTFAVIKREGDWLLIKLLGNKQGFVHKDQVEMQ